MPKRKAIPEYVKNKVLLNQEGCCNICFEKLEMTHDGIPLYDFDHIEMHSITQNDDIENLQAIHLNCHRIKTVREIRERRKKFRYVKDVHTEETVTLTNTKPKFQEFRFDNYNFVNKKISRDQTPNGLRGNKKRKKNLHRQEDKKEVLVDETKET